MLSSGNIQALHPRPWIPSLRSRSESPQRITQWGAAPLKRLTSSKNLQRITNKQNSDYKVMRNLENEYIRSLQQQIYLLELENNYIRQQAANAVDMQPAMIEEASKTMTKVKELQERIDSLELELYRKEAHIGILEQKHNRANQQLKENLLNHDRETDELKRQLLTLRGEREIALRDGLQKEAQLTELRNDLARQKSSLAAAEVQLDVLRAKLENESAHVKDLEKALVDKKTQMLQMNSTLKQLELQYRQDLTRADMTTNSEFQAELERMRQQLSNCFLTAENERFIRDRQAGDVDRLVQENAQLNADLVKLKRQADETRSTLERIEDRHNKELAELNALRQREKDLLFANATLRQDLNAEQKKITNLEKQLDKQERAYDHVLSRPGKQPQPPAAQHVAQLEQEKFNMMNHISTMQRELMRQAAKLEELQLTQQQQQQQQCQPQQYQKPSVSNPVSPSKSPQPSPRRYTLDRNSPERMPMEMPSSSSPRNFRPQSHEGPTGRSGTPTGVTRQGVMFD